MNKILIIGQGAAGSFLAWELLKRGQQIVIVDNDHLGSSSMISAGIVNPVTGKRFAVTDGFDDYFKRAQQTYRELSDHFSEVFFEELDIVRIFQDKDEHDHWQRKVDLNTGQQYCRRNNPIGTFHPSIKDPWGSVTIKKSGFCHTVRLLQALKEYFLERGVLLNQHFSYSDLTVNSDHVTFGGNTFGTVVFCEGYRAQWNPWFNWIPFNSVKGELLRIKIQGEDFPRVIINKGKWCAPTFQDQWTAGASYIWNQLDCEPTDEAKNQIIAGLKRCFDYPVHVTGHRAGVRPVVDDQTVALGRHPHLPMLAIFNGLGSKGFLTAPAYAEQMAEYLCGSKQLNSRYNVCRFQDRLEKSV